MAIKMADEPSTHELEIAYKRTGLERAGVNLQKAISTPMLKSCLMHIANNQRVRTTRLKESPKQYWWNEH